MFAHRAINFLDVPRERMLPGASLFSLRESTLVNEECDGVDADIRLTETPLEVEVVKQIRMVLTCGGPHIEARATITDDGIVDARIFGLWGASRIEAPICESNGLYRALEQYADLVQS